MAPIFMRDYLEKIPSPFTFGLEKPMYRALPVGEGVGSTLHHPSPFEKNCNLTIAYIFVANQISNLAMNQSTQIWKWQDGEGW